MTKGRKSVFFFLFTLYILHSPICSSRLVGHLQKLLPKKAQAASPETKRILIFALYKKEAQRVEQMLQYKGFSVGGLHGDMSQNARIEALNKFKTGETALLVATDVAARGLDIPNVAAVINYTFPLTIEDYIHRIGRTGTDQSYFISLFHCLRLSPSPPLRGSDSSFHVYLHLPRLHRVLIRTMILFFFLK